MYQEYTVHEFGHAFGCSHEQIRPDMVIGCTPDKNPTAGTTPFGRWDRQSVMNYCNPIDENGGVLSAGDIAMVKYFYGDPNPVADFDMTPITYLLLN